MIPPLSSDYLAAGVWKCWNGLYFSTKKASVPLKGQKLNIILKYSKTSAVPPNLSIHDHSLMYYHTHLRNIPPATFLTYSGIKKTLYTASHLYTEFFIHYYLAD